jgi:hypothetical protein
MPDSIEEQTTDVAHADNFYKVEKWTKDGIKVDSLLYAGNGLERALLMNACKRRRLQNY